MKVTFSRHANRRAKLYGITEIVIQQILAEKKLVQGKQQIVESVDGYKYPLKVIFSVENDTIVVITTYPLKKGLKP